MIVNETITIVIAIIIAYLLGSIPFAYIFTHLGTGKDIRHLGSGNGGAYNVFREVDLKIAVSVALFDVGKHFRAFSGTVSDSRTYVVGLLEI